MGQWLLEQGHRHPPHWSGNAVIHDYCAGESQLKTTQVMIELRIWSLLTDQLSIMLLFEYFACPLTQVGPVADHTIQTK